MARIGTWPVQELKEDIEMRLPGFTAAVALYGSHRHYNQAATATVARSLGVVLPADDPSAGKGGGVFVNLCRYGVCPTDPTKCVKLAACHPRFGILLTPPKACGFANSSG